MKIFLLINGYNILLLKSISTQFYQNVKNPNRTNKDVVENPNEFDLGFETFLATCFVLTCCNRCGCNRLVVIIVVVVITKVSAVVTIVEVVKLVAVQLADLERASRLTGSELAGSGLTESEIAGSGLTGSETTGSGPTPEMIGFRGF